MKNTVMILLLLAMLGTLCACGQPNAAQTEAAAPTAAPSEEPEEVTAPVPSNEEFVEGYFRVVGAYHPGTAGSSLKQAQAACGAVRFAADNALNTVDVPQLREGLLNAWESMTDEERGDFDANFLGIASLIDSCRDDWEAEKGAFEDAGVGEEMAALLNDEAAREAWSTLCAHTLTMGNTEG